MGIRALAKTLSTYESKHGLNTVEDIIRRYAPNSENDTSSYIKSVSNSLGVKSIDEINVQAVMPDLIKAIIKHENGSQPYSDTVINQGIKLSK